MLLHCTWNRIVLSHSIHVLCRVQFTDECLVALSVLVYMSSLWHLDREEKAAKVSRNRYRHNSFHVWTVNSYTQAKNHPDSLWEVPLDTSVENHEMIFAVLQRSWAKRHRLYNWIQNGIVFFQQYNLQIQIGQPRSTTTTSKYAVAADRAIIIICGESVNEMNETASHTDAVSLKLSLSTPTCFWVSYKIRNTLIKYNSRC